MIKVFAKATCGCCTVEMKFKNEKSVQKAFQKTGMDSAAVITDDEGVEHSDVDTFYGYSIDSTEADKRGLDYLVKQIVKGGKK